MMSPIVTACLLILIASTSFATSDIIRPDGSSGFPTTETSIGAAPEQLIVSIAEDRHASQDSGIQDRQLVAAGSAGAGGESGTSGRYGASGGQGVNGRGDPCSGGAGYDVTLAGLSVGAPSGWTDVTTAPLDDTSRGRGVAWGDYDNDGDLDLYLANGVLGNANRMFRNDDGVFVDASSGPLGTTDNTIGVAWGDVDNDGDLDLYLCNAVDSSNRLLRNEGGGTFTDITTPPLGDTAIGRGVSWIDYDLDGDVDLYIANTNASGGNKLLRNDGGEIFSVATSGPLSGMGYGHGAVWCDYDGDGDPDVYQCNEGANRLCRNDGNGVFVDVAVGTVLADGSFCVGAAWGDHDNDGDLDLYISNRNEENKLFRNDGTGGFEDVTASSGPLGDSGDGRSVAWADYDLDGDLDLYLVNHGQPNRLFCNEGSVFVDMTSEPLGDSGDGVGMAWGDYDADGDPDIYLAKDLTPNKLFRNDGTHENHWLHVDLVGTISNAAGIGARLLVTAAGVSQVREVTAGSGCLSMNSLTAEFGLGSATDVDLVEIEWTSGIVQQVEAVAADQAILLIESEPWQNIATGPLGDDGLGQGVAWGDYDGDGDLDLYLTNTGENKLLRNDGGGVFEDVTTVPISEPGDSRGVVWGDFDGDDDLDLYVANRSSPNRLFRNEGGGGFTDATTGPLGDESDSHGTAWGDYDNDGDLDLYIVNFEDFNRLLRNEGDGVFTAVTAGPIDDPGKGFSGVWGDYDSDGDLDLYLVNDLANKLFRNDGNDVFREATTGPLGDDGNGRGAAWGDYDNDGDLDLYLANVFQTAVGTNRLLRNDGGGQFVDVARSLLGNRSNGTGVAWGDYDNDGNLDLYLANADDSNKLFRNRGQGSFVNASSPLVADSATSVGVAWADFDADGDLDLYVANHGQPNRLLANVAPTSNHWLHVNLEGSISNTTGIGARIRAVTDGRSQIREVSGGMGYLSQSSLTGEFGLADATVVDSLQVLWPSGVLITWLDVDVDQVISVWETSQTGIAAAATSLRFQVHPNYPNPFNPSTKIHFTLPAPVHVRVRVYDMAGRLVRTLVDEMQNPGAHTVTWDATNERDRPVASGVYYYRVEAGANAESSPMVVLR